MNAANRIQRQVAKLRWGKAKLFEKINHAWRIPTKLILFVLAIPVVVAIRLIRPWLLVRWGRLIGPRIGHFAANAELYLCERDAGINAPAQRHIDFFFIAKPVSNNQLATMWARILRIRPTWFLSPIHRINRLIPGGAVHEVGENTNNDRDINNLLDRIPSHLRFSSCEDTRGELGLRALGVPEGMPFVCLIVRDAAYLEAHTPGFSWSYHNYRDSNIQNYAMAAEELANRGYYVFRMGAKVHAPLESRHPRVIDYATNGMRSDFMDIYLGAKCTFCISTSTGYDAVPLVFRRPIVFVNSVPLGYFFTFSTKFICLTRHHFETKTGRELTLAAILSNGLGFCLSASEYEKRGIHLIENSPEEIRDVAIEMAERLNGIWQPHADDEALQTRFWKTFPSSETRNGKPLHGEIRSRYGAMFLRNNRWWLDYPAQVALGVNDKESAKSQSTRRVKN